MMIMADIPRRKASQLLRCNEKTLASILSYWVNQAVEALDLSDVTKLAIDETPPHDAAKQNEQRTVDQAGSLSKAYPKTGRAFRIVQTLDLFYASKDDKEAAKQFKQLYSWMKRSRLTPMKEAAETLMNHEREILHYFHERLTNAVCEGINSMIQAAKRKARGYNTFEGFAAMIYLVAGKLELPVPDPF